MQHILLLEPVQRRTVGAAQRGASQHECPLSIAWGRVLGGPTGGAHLLCHRGRDIHLLEARTRTAPPRRESCAAAARDWPAIAAWTPLRTHTPLTTTCTDWSVPPAPQDSQRATLLWRPMVPATTPSQDIITVLQASQAPEACPRSPSPPILTLACTLSPSSRR